MSSKPSAAVTTLAVVHDTPLVTNLRLYSARGPLSASYIVSRTNVLSVLPCQVASPSVNTSSACSVQKCTSSSVSSSWFCSAWMSEAGSMPCSCTSPSIMRRNATSPVTRACW